ncbi:unnamed protein product, partial [Mesorhabditis spiculigera]
MDAQQAALNNMLAGTIEVLERQVDQTLVELEKVSKDEDELAALRRRRIAEMKKTQTEKQEKIERGHGDLKNVNDVKEFFANCKKTDTVVCLLTGQNTESVQLLRLKLTKLAKIYFTTLFVEASSERVPYLFENMQFNRSRLPSIAVIKRNICVGYLYEVAGNELNVLEKRLSENGALDPQDKEQRARPAKPQPTKTIRGRNYDDSDDDY